LKALIIETGGMPGSLLDQVCKAELPVIEHLELWLGEDGYGWSGSLDQLQPLLEGKIFPNLKYLGLRDSEEADRIAELIGSITLTRSLEVLDLSLGTLSDEGACALANSPQLNQLRLLDLHHHYISKEGQDKLRKLTCNINLDDPQPDDEDGGTKYRYVAVSE
jgi:hypothetical protein